MEKIALDGPKWCRERIFPANPRLVDILGDMDFEFEKFYFSDFLDPQFPDFQVPTFWISKNLGFPTSNNLDFPPSQHLDSQLPKI